MNEKGKPTVTVEDLLRLKRAERPSAEFWTEFDRELRAKQLAALVEKRPWWSALPQHLRRLARYNLPLGATAVLAITLVSLRDYRPIVSGPVPTHRESAPVTPIAAATPDNHPIASVNVATASPANLSVSDDAALASDSRPDAVPSIENESNTLASNSSDNTYASDADRPSARSIAENRAAAEAILGTTHSGFESRALPVNLVTQEPLAQISNPSEARRSRFATAFAAAAVGTSPVPTARVASRLSDEQLYDTIHRFGASGNSVSFKF